MENLPRIWLKEIRNANQMTQKQAAQAIGLPLSTYACYENGMRTPTGQNALKISRYFGFDMSLFYDAFCVKKGEMS